MIKTKFPHVGPLVSEGLGNPLQVEVEYRGYIIRLWWAEDDWAKKCGAPHWIDFQVLEIAYWTYPKETAVVGVDFNDEPIDPQIVSGFVKWDGCTQFEVAPIHVDSGFAEFIDVMIELRRLCAEVMLPEDVKEYWKVLDILKPKA